jgi:nucleotide-binding universal stress UspA family protein
MNAENARPPYTLVVGIDYSELSRLVLQEAVFLARGQQRSHIHLLHAAPVANAATGLLSTADPSMASGPATASLGPEMSNNMQRYVEQILRDLAHDGHAADSTSSIRWTTHLRHTEPAQALAQLASDTEADLILVGTHGHRGLARFLLGSVAEAVVRLAPCPVLVVRPRGAQSRPEEVKIEPPCPECVATRQASGGKVFWCERHSQHHERAHTYHFTPFRDSHQSGMLLHPLD